MNMKNTIVEISTSRILQHFLDDSSLAIVSTFRVERTKSENMNLLRKFKNQLKAKKIGFTEIVSRWVEQNQETGENESSDERSLLAYGISLEDAMAFGKEFQQSSIIFKNNEKCAEVCTNDFIDWEGHEFKTGDVVRVFNVRSKTPFNLEDAKEIFAKRKGGPASNPIKSNRAFRLSEMYQVESVHPNTFSTTERLIRLWPANM